MKTRVQQVHEIYKDQFFQEEIHEKFNNSLKIRTEEPKKDELKKVITPSKNNEVAGNDNISNELPKSRK